MTELEKKIAAKIPGEDTGIEIKHSFCSICSPNFHCGMDAYVKDGKLLKIEGTPDHPMNQGLMCTKGANNRAYIYREDRIRTPLRRTGPRGSGEFEPISWEEAYKEISNRLLSIREQYGPESVIFYSGYEKWYRFMLQRFAYVFGSPNYGTESSTCFTASELAWRDITGRYARADMAHSRLFVAWASGSHYSRYLNARKLEALKRAGGKVIIVDPRYTPSAQRLADLYLRVKPGTDGLLASCIAGIIIRNGWHAQEYIDKYVHGFREYSNYVTSLDVEETSRITTVPVSDILKAAEMIGTTRPMCLETNPTSLIHQTNGYQTAKSVFALSVITGNYDTLGGNLPLQFTFCEQGSGFTTCEHEFEHERAPENVENCIGAEHFPLWSAFTRQMQAVDMPRSILEGNPNPIHGFVGFGLNYRMLPDSENFRKALESLDFLLVVDLFYNDTAKLADIVLPACSSFEREEMKVYPGGVAKYYTPVIDSLYESRSDAQILQDLAIWMDLDDDLLRGGYRRCVEHIFHGSGFNFDESASQPLPVHVPAANPFVPGQYVNNGCDTPTGKLELYSETVAAVNGRLGEERFSPVPKWYEPAVRPTEEHPYLLLTGVRIPNAIHSRLHKVPWARSLRPQPMADISLKDAERLGVQEGDPIRLHNEFGELTLAANPNGMIADGQVYIFHGYSEADAGQLIGPCANDPYSGFPGFKCGTCAISKVQEEKSAK